MIKVICFVRVSTTQQDYDAQKQAVYQEALKEYQASEIQIVEGKESASKLSIENRNTLSELYDVLSHNPHVERIITFAVDRISRRLSDFIQIVEDFKARNIDIYFLNPMPLHSMIKDANGNMVENKLASIILIFLSYFAKLEIDLKNDRVNAKKVLMRSEGKITAGATCYGYIKDVSTKKPVIVKEQADVIRFLFEEYSLGKSSLSSLANVLDSKGIKGFDGKYASYTVKNILKNKHYLGEDIYPKIIDKELFDKVQNIMSSKAGNKNKAKTNAVIALGRGLLYDGDTLLSTNTFDKRYVLRDGTSYVYQLSFKPVDKIIIYASKVYYARYYQMIAHASNTELRQQIEDYSKSMERYKENIASLELQKSKAFKAYIKGLVDEESFEKMSKEIQKQIKDLNKKSDELNSKINSIKNEIEKMTYSKNAYKDFNNLDDASKKNVIDKMIEKIITKRENKNEYILEVIPTDVIKGKTFEFKIVTKSRSSKVYIKLEDIYLPL